MESSQLDLLRQLAASFRSGIERARGSKVPGALPYFPDGVVVGSPTAFHHALTAHVREAAAENLASLSADDMARLARQLAAIEPCMPALDAPPA